MKTIMIDDEVYNKLKKMKGEKSFSKFLNYLAGDALGRSKDNLKKFYGILSDEEAAVWENAIEESRNNFKERI